MCRKFPVNPQSQKHTEKDGRQHCDPDLGDQTQHTEYGTVFLHNDSSFPSDCIRFFLIVSQIRFYLFV